MPMALWKSWRSEPALLTEAIERGLHQLGFEAIKPEQLTAVESVLTGKDVFVSVPTGFGKSLMFQILPFCAAGLLQQYFISYSSQ